MKPFKAQRIQKSFFDAQIYDRLIPADHILVKLNKTIDFSFIEEECQKYYSLRGRKGENPVVLFKMLLLTYMFDLSERDIEEHCNYNMLFKHFLGLEADEWAPDHSTLSRFRDRIGVEGFTAIFNRLVEFARQKGLVSDKLRIVDSTHMQAKVDVFRAQSKPSPEGVKPEPQSLPGGPDPDARKGAKSKKKRFFGYKHHIGIDSQHGVITNSATSGGNIHDKDYLLEMMDGPPPEAATADKIYDIKHLHQQLKKRGIESHIVRKKNSPKPDNPEYQRSSKLSKRIERVFAVLKMQHSGRRAQYWGRAKTTIQNLLTDTLYDLKVMTAILT